MTFQPEQERDRVQGARIGWLLGWVVMIGTIGVAVSTWMLNAHGPPPPSTHVVAPRTIGTIEQTPLRTTAVGWAVRDRQRRELDGFRWVDRDAGLAQIPIERAMAIVAQEVPR